MTSLHLTSGSPCPPLQDGKVRIYAMRFCPYAQRALLTSAAKNVETDIVWINLKDKPEWLVEKSPGGKVPSVEIGDGRIVYESLIIADYFDDAYPEPNLHSKDPVSKAVDRILVEGWGKAGSPFYQLAFVGSVDAEKVPELIKEFEGVVSTYSKELEKRGTKFFSGDERPGMLDYMIWPWFERRPVIPMFFPDAANWDEIRQNSAAIDQWYNRMKEDPAVAKYFVTPEIHHRYCITVKEGNIDFDMLTKV
ncbi:unnamed protein product [Orchesella dallaii]|uniref:Pyrimidodiazepine synthase n=1 Tax=Orchesella dallaii TaxID=48710 RepID=A0ABP1R9N6_9HEXA